MENPLDMFSAPSLAISFWSTSNSHSIRGYQSVGWSGESEVYHQVKEGYANQFKEYRFDIW